MKNDFYMRIKANLDNEKFIRSTIAAFVSYINPTLEVIQEIKTAVSEVVTNCIVHAYQLNSENYIDINVSLDEDLLSISIKDFGVGIANVTKAREPFFTTKESEERSGMGFTLMESFMDSVDVKSQINLGTEVIMKKKISGEKVC